MIKRYVYELDVLKQKAGETAETNERRLVTNHDFNVG